MKSENIEESNKLIKQMTEILTELHKSIELLTIKKKRVARAYMD